MHTSVQERSGIQVKGTSQLLAKQQGRQSREGKAAGEWARTAAHPFSVWCRMIVPSPSVARSTSTMRTPESTAAARAGSVFSGGKARAVGRPGTGFGTSPTPRCPMGTLWWWRRAGIANAIGASGGFLSCSLLLACVSWARPYEGRATLALPGSSRRLPSSPLAAAAAAVNANAVAIAVAASLAAAESRAAPLLLAPRNVS